MGFAKEFKEFAMKGNVVDLAVGVIIGGAFGKIVTSLVDDIIMPLIGKASGGVSFANKYIALTEEVSTALSTNPKLPLEEAKKIGAVFAYGNFIQTVIDFLIVAFCIFLMIKAINRLKKDEPKPAPPAPTPSEELLKEIRDLLKKQS
jgi:large conductance mechanosensitive channel